VGIWYFTQAKSLDHLILLALAFVLTSLSPTDLFPKFLRREFISPYHLKALPCVLIWLKIQYDFLKFRGGQSS